MEVDVTISFRLCFVVRSFSEGVRPDNFQVIPGIDAVPFTVNLVNDVAQGEVVQVLEILVDVGAKDELLFHFHD